MSENSSNETTKKTTKDSRKPRTQPRIGKALGVALWVAFAFYLAQALLAGVLLLLNAAGVKFDTLNAAVLNTSLAGAVYLLSLVLAIGLPWWIKRWKVTRRELGVHQSLSWRDLLLSPPAYVLYMLLSASTIAVATQLIPSFDITQPQDVLFSGLGQNYEFILAFTTLVIIAPIAEELLFRGYLFGKLLRYVPIWLAVLLTSILFGAVHGQWNVGVDTFVLSLVLCSLRLYTGTIWAGVVLHMIKNGIAFYLLFVNPSLVTGLMG